MSKSNRSEASRFLDALNPDDASQFTFVTADDSDRKDPALIRVLHGALDQHWDELCRLNAAGAGVFVVVNETNLKGRAASDVVRVRAVFVDMGGAPMPLEYQFKPQIVTETAPGRWNLFWLVEGRCPLDQFATVQRRLIELFNMSPGDCDLARVMRLPGCINHTRMGAFRVRLVEVHGDASGAN